MLAIVQKRKGGPETLLLERLADPAPGQGEVLIEVYGAGVNRADLVQREGRYRMPPGVPDLLGLEVSGKVTALGDGVEWPRLGEMVVALVAAGGYAEYCLAPAANCLPLPATVGPIEGAALPEAVMTVWANLMEHGRYQTGETVLVHGGASGIGVIAIQLAKALGARIVTTAAGTGRAASLRELGADLVVDYLEQDFVEHTLAFTGGAGVNVILDMVGGDYVARNIATLAHDGRIVNIAFQKGATVTVDLSALQLRHGVLTGSRLRPRSVAEKARIAQACERIVWPLLERRRLVPVIDSVFSLADAGAAHRRMESGGLLGKIILDARRKP